MYAFMIKLKISWAGYMLFLLIVPSLWAAEIDFEHVEKSIARVVCRADSVSTSTGSGFVISHNGYLATSQHVIAHTCPNLEIIFNASTTVNGVVVWSSAELDLALIKLERSGFEPLPLAPIEFLHKGEKTWAIGYPGYGDLLGTQENFFQASIKDGIVSKKNQRSKGAGCDRNKCCNQSGK